MKATRKPLGRPPKTDAEKPITVPLRLPPEVIAEADRIIADRHYEAPSRNAILREMISRGIEAYNAEQGKGRN